MRETLFKDYFWNTDLISTAGYDSIIQHMNDGRKNCKEFEDFMKERAVIEERYGKDLLSLSRKKPCGQTELNSLKRALDVFKNQGPLNGPRPKWVASSLKKKQSCPFSGGSMGRHPPEVESIGQSHMQLAQMLREEAKKMEDFREKQKFHRKKIELIMDAIHKNRNLQYKKTMDAKRLYEQRCRDKDEAEQAVHRSTNLVTQKQQEKLFVKLAQTKTALEDSDRVYQMNVAAVEKIREEWQTEHIKACEFFESQEYERIIYFRNALWLHVNHLSQECVKNDECYEEVRKSLEMSSVEKDIEYFVSTHKTGTLPPTPVTYDNYYNTQKNAAPGRNQAPAPPGMGRRPQLPVPSSGPGDPEYSTVDGYSLIQHH